MRITHIDYNFIYELKENDRGILIVENAMLFRKIIDEMRRSIVDKEEIFIFSENNKIIKPWDMVDLVINPIELEINTKKVLTRLYEKIREEINLSELLVENNEICQNIEKYFLHIVDNIDVELTYKDKIDVTDILKMLDVKILEKYDDQTEKLIEYIRVNYELMNIKSFIFVGLHTFFNEYEIEKIYEFAEYNKVNIFLIENRQPEKMSNYTQVKIIDKDGCEISFDM